MNEEKRNVGKRQAPSQREGVARWWEEHCLWVEGLSGGQLLRYRLLQVATVLAVVIIIAYFALGAWMRVPEVQGKPSTVEPKPGQEDIQNSQTGNGRKDGVYTFLVAGKDVVSGSTDTMLLLTYDINNKTMSGMNLPRDTMVNVSTRSKRLNTVYAYNRKGENSQEKNINGMNALRNEVANITGILPDFYVLVEWEAVGRLVDALGGVEFEVPFDMDYDDPEQNLHIHQKAGLRLLSGEDAMQVIRHRKNNDGSHSRGDVGRMEVQQDFLKAVVKKCLQPSIFLKINSLVEIFKENVETDLTVGNILAFAEKAVGMNPDTGIVFFTAPVAEYFVYRTAAMLTLDPGGMVDVVNQKMNPYTQDVTIEDLQILIYHGNNGFTLTSGELKDSSLAQPYTPPAAPPKEENEPDPEENQQPAEENNSEPESSESEEVPEPMPEGETEVPPATGEETLPEQDGDTEQPEVPAELEQPAEQPEVPAEPEQPAQQETPQEENIEQSGGETEMPVEPAPAEEAA